jgi:hypothetical protein
MIGILGTVLRGSLLLASSAGASALAFGRTAALRHPATPAYDDLLVAGAAWALVLGTVWAVVVCAAAVLEVATSGRLALTSRVGCPASARRALLAGLGVVLASGGAVVAGPVSAAPTPFDRAVPGQGSGRGFTLPVPARPTGVAYQVPRQRVEVRPGDSLWRLARQRAPAASTPDIAQLVERAYRTNRRTIGPDPDLIQPGQRLVLPRQRPHTPPQPDPRRETP